MTDMNGCLIFVNFYEVSVALRIMACAAGIAINLLMLIATKKRLIPASLVSISYGALGGWFWYVFVVRHGLAF
jgi:hypothetical protein